MAAGPITINSFWCCPTQSRRPFHENFLKVKKTKGCFAQLKLNHNMQSYQG